MKSFPTSVHFVTDERDFVYDVYRNDTLQGIRVNLFVKVSQIAYISLHYHAH